MNYISNSLTDIAARFKIENEACQRNIKDSLQHAIAAGQLLLEAKSQLKHGDWLPWLKKSCAVSEQIAQRYMRVAKMPDNLELVKASTVTDLSLRGALRAISNPKSPDPPGERQPPGGKAFDKIASFIRAYEAQTGSLPTENEITRNTGASPSTVHTVSAVFRAVRSNANVTAPIRFTKAQDHDVETRIKALDKEREKTFNDRVIAENQRQIKSLFPDLEKLREDAKRNEKFYREQIEKRAIFTKAEYIDILFCIRNPSVSQDRKDRATVAFESKKLQLTGEP